MLEPLRKLMLAGLGALDLTEERARAVFDDLVKRGEMSDKEARELFTNWTRRAGEQRARLQQQVDEALQQAVGKMGLVRRSELETLQARLEALERQAGATARKPEVPPEER